jgi:hypothetical protein
MEERGRGYISHVISYILSDYDIIGYPCQGFRWACPECDTQAVSPGQSPSITFTIMIS